MPPTECSWHKWLQRSLLTKGKGVQKMGCPVPVKGVQLSEGKGRW